VKIVDRMEIFDANVLIQLVIEKNSIVMSTEPTLVCWYMYVTQCLFQSSNTKCKLDTCLIEMYRKECLYKF